MSIEIFSNTNQYVRSNEDDFWINVKKLSIIICDIQSDYSNKIIQWINENTIDSICKQGSGTVTVYGLERKTFNQMTFELITNELN
jgi:hypothetical protein